MNHSQESPVRTVVLTRPLVPVIGSCGVIQAMAYAKCGLIGPQRSWFHRLARALDISKTDSDPL